MGLFSRLLVSKTWQRRLKSLILEPRLLLLNPVGALLISSLLSTILSSMLPTLLDVKPSPALPVERRLRLTVMSLLLTPRCWPPKMLLSAARIWESLLFTSRLELPEATDLSSPDLALKPL